MSFFPITALGPSFFWICLSKCTQPSCDCEVSFNMESKQTHMKLSCFWCPSFWRVASLLEDGVGSQKTSCKIYFRQKMMRWYKMWTSWMWPFENFACPAVIKEDFWEPGLSLTEKEQIEQSSLIGGVLGENSFWLFDFCLRCHHFAVFLHCCSVSIQKALGHIFGMSLSQLQAQLRFNSETGETGSLRSFILRIQCDQVCKMQALWRQVRTLSLRILFLRHLSPGEKWRKAVQHGCEGRGPTVDGEARLKSQNAALLFCGPTFNF